MHGQHNLPEHSTLFLVQRWVRVNPLDTASHSNIYKTVNVADLILFLHSEQGQVAIMMVNIISMRK